jgi:hypothetical protein
LILLYLKNNRTILLIGGAISVGLALLTRYSGLAFIFTGICFLLIFSQAPWKKRIIDVITYGILSCLPTIGWLIWLKTQSLNVRSAPTNVNWGDQFTKFRLAAMEIFWSWIPFTSLLPRYSYNLARNLFIIFFLLALVLVSLTVWKMLKNNQKVLDPTNGSIFSVLMIFLALAYLFVLAFSYIFTYPSPDLISRTFLPVQLAVILGIFSLILFFIRPWQNAKWLISIPVFIAVVISISYLHDSLDLVARYHQNGAGYTAKAWRNAPIFNQLEHLPGNISLISNESALVLFYTNRPAYDISEIIDRSPQTITSRFGDDPNDTPQKAFLENGAALVLFNSIRPQFDQLYGAQSASRLENFIRGLSLYSQTEDGAIYFYPSRQLP